MDSEAKITVLCLFCHTPLKADENTEYESGSLIECNSCGELNDYDSVIEVAKEKGIEDIIERAISQAETQLNRTMKNLFK